MAHKHTQAQIDSVINMWRGKHAVEKMIAEYDGRKWSTNGSRAVREQTWSTNCTQAKLVSATHSTDEELQVKFLWDFEENSL